MTSGNISSCISSIPPPQPPIVHFVCKLHGHHVCVINLSFLVLLLNSLTLTIFWTVPKKYTTLQDLIWYFFISILFSVFASPYLLFCRLLASFALRHACVVQSSYNHPFVNVFSFINFMIHSFCLVKFRSQPSVSFQLTCI